MYCVVGKDGSEVIFRSNNLVGNIDLVLLIIFCVIFSPKKINPNDKFMNMFMVFLFSFFNLTVPKRLNPNDKFLNMYKVF